MKDPSLALSRATDFSFSAAPRQHRRVASVGHLRYDSGVKSNAVLWVFLPLAIGLTLFVVNPFLPLEAPEIGGNDVSAPGTRNPGTLPIDYSGMPLQLRIPRIGVDAAFEPVGVLADGSMGVPKQPDRVGWYAFGPRPGERGSAVVAGHRGWQSGEAVFDRLSELRVGDTILVADAENVWHTFIVRGSQPCSEKAASSSTSSLAKANGTVR